MIGYTSDPEASIAVGGKTMKSRFPNDYVGVSRRNATEVRVDNSDVVFVGYGVVAPEYGWDDYKGVDVTRQDDRHAGQRPGRPRPGRPGASSTRHVQGAGDDLLRPLDLQVRDRLGEGGRGRDRRPRDGAGGLSVRGRRRELGSRELRRSDSPTPNEGRVAVEGWVTLRQAKELLAALRPELRRAQEGGRAREGLPARRARRQGRTSTSQDETSVSIAVEERRRQARRVRPEAQGRVRHLHRPLGPPRPRRALKGDQIFNGAPDNASGVARCSRSPGLHEAPKPAPKRSSSSSSSRPRRRACSARSTTRRTRSTRSTKTAGRHQHGRREPTGARPTTS